MDFYIKNWGGFCKFKKAPPILGVSRHVCLKKLSCLGGKKSFQKFRPDFTTQPLNLMKIEHFLHFWGEDFYCPRAWYLSSSSKMGKKPSGVPTGHLRVTFATITLALALHHILNPTQMTQHMGFSSSLQSRTFPTVANVAPAFILPTFVPWNAFLLMHPPGPSNLLRQAPLTKILFPWSAHLSTSI